MGIITSLCKIDVKNKGIYEYMYFINILINMFAHAHTQWFEKV